tara:strand:- start:13052 stop:13687 length:636 start_codon:yes stop_codon:yes gene_type:complete
LSINKKNISLLNKELKSHISTRLMIVTKNQSSQDINELMSQGFKLFGENRVQEAKLKYQSIISCNNLELHLIGPLQTNKVKNALKIFDVIQTIDRISLVDEIAKQLLKLSSVRTKKFYIQVNIGEEEQKSGVFKKNLQDLYNYSINCNLVIHGLMCIPPNTQDPSNYFKEMIKIRDNINKKLKLSMGMSNDYKIALNFQSDIIRIGSLIFE